MKKIILITSIPSPYQVEFFNYIAQNSKEFSIRVLYLSQMTPGRMWKIPKINHEHKIFKGRFLKGIAYGLYNLDIQEILRELKSKEPLYIVSGGYGDISYQMIMYYLIFSKKFWIYWGEQPKLNNLLIKRVVWQPIKKAKAILGIGNYATRLYKEIFKKPSYDLPYFRDLSYLSEINRIKKQENEKTVIFYNGSLITRKGPDILIEAFIRLKEKGINAELHLVGEGNMKEKLIRMVPEKLSSDIIFHGFVDWQELPKYYAAGDIFVFPTRYDGWAMVINEALAAGMPVITTYNAGAVFDLIQDGYNGFLCEDNNSKSIAERIEFLSGNKALMYQMGLNARASMQKFTLHSGLEKFEKIIQSVVANKDNDIEKELRY